MWGFSVKSEVWTVGTEKFCCDLLVGWFVGLEFFNVSVYGDSSIFCELGVFDASSACIVDEMQVFACTRCLVIYVPCSLFSANHGRLRSGLCVSPRPFHGGVFRLSDVYGCGPVWTEIPGCWNVRLVSAWLGAV